jgi:hypothetical protein
MKIREDKLCGHVALLGVDRLLFKICTDNLKLKHNSKDLDVDGRIILNVS